MGQTLWEGKKELPASLTGSRTASFFSAASYSDGVVYRASTPHSVCALMVLISQSVFS